MTHPGRKWNRNHRLIDPFVLGPISRKRIDMDRIIRLTVPRPQKRPPYKHGNKEISSPRHWKTYGPGLGGPKINPIREPLDPPKINPLSKPPIPERLSQVIRELDLDKLLHYHIDNNPEPTAPTVRELTPEDRIEIQRLAERLGRSQGESPASRPDLDVDIGVDNAPFGIPGGIDGNPFTPQ